MRRSLSSRDPRYYAMVLSAGRTEDNGISRLRRIERCYYLLRLGGLFVVCAVLFPFRLVCCLCHYPGGIISGCAGGVNAYQLGSDREASVYSVSDNLRGSRCGSVTRESDTSWVW
ncbi:uncharacterized protein YALI1_A19249g [Yarrowia lipolytica]|uniref:Uncharacterized protein n=1 Tax=Yarrowia lipolytica TaxID=4952 RepID=A0A1D8N5C6_YARLL|nr:hypothetical protein YALI1_A19249g [Yarrowia lipolytica]